MQQVAPSTSLRIVYLIQDHTDTNTYYVRSVVRDSVTGAILATVNLADTGDRRFYGHFQTPNAEDMYIDITTTAYSDSGYTIKSPDKYEVLEQYFVKTLWGMQFGGAGGGSRGPGEKIDYKLIKKLLKEVIDEEEKGDEPEKYDDTRVLSRLETLQLCVNDIKMPNMADFKPKDVNFGPVIKKLNEITTILNTEEPEEPEKKFDYTPILDSVSKIKEDLISKIEVIAKNTEPKPIEIPKEPENKKTRVLGGYKFDMPVDLKRVKNLMR